MNFVDSKLFVVMRWINMDFISGFLMNCYSLGTTLHLWGYGPYCRNGRFLLMWGLIMLSKSMFAMIIM